MNMEPITNESDMLVPNIVYSSIPATIMLVTVYTDALTGLAVLSAEIHKKNGMNVHAIPRYNAMIAPSSRILGLVTKNNGMLRRNVQTTEATVRSLNRIFIH